MTTQKQKSGLQCVHVIFHIPAKDLQQLSHPIEALRLINKTGDHRGRSINKGKMIWFTYG